MPRLAKSPNLKVFLRTAVTEVERSANGDVTAITAVQRTARPNYTEWSDNLSEELDEWYLPEDTKRFTKETLVFRGRVFIEVGPRRSVTRIARVLERVFTLQQEGGLSSVGCGRLSVSTHETISPRTGQREMGIVQRGGRPVRWDEPALQSGHPLPVLTRPLREPPVLSLGDRAW